MTVTVIFPGQNPFIQGLYHSGRFDSQETIMIVSVTEEKVQETCFVDFFLNNRQNEELMLAFMPRLLLLARYT